MLSLFAFGVVSIFAYAFYTVPALAYNVPRQLHGEAPIINPPQWEYKRLESTYGSPVDDALFTALGKQGWEHYWQGANVFYFKRRRYVD
jgi:hypothetical protein